MLTDNPSTVKAQVNFYVPPADGSQPFYVIASNNVNFGTETREVLIENVRGKEDQYTLDTAGFQWVRSPTKHTSFQNDEEIKREYYPECIEFLKKLTGAGRIVIFDHTVRRRRPDLPDTAHTRQPATNAHGDQTPNSAAYRVRLHMGEDEAPELLKKRFQIINIWRPIRHLALDTPLALCDYRSVDVEKDAHPTKLIYPDRIGEAYGISYNPKHEWKYLRGMTPEEVTLIKCWDSIKDGRIAVFTPHTAFTDPSTPADAPLRESIEVRALVFYD